MAGKRKILAILLAAFFILIAVATIALTHDYAPPELGHALLDHYADSAWKTSGWSVARVQDNAQRKPLGN